MNRFNKFWIASVIVFFGVSITSIAQINLEFKIVSQLMNLSTIEYFMKENKLFFLFIKMQVSLLLVLGLILALLCLKHGEVFWNLLTTHSL